MPKVFHVDIPTDLSNAILKAKTDEEVEICRPMVEKHIALINPEILIMVGATAAQNYIRKDVKITSETTELFYKYSNQYLRNHINATTIQHPAYLLRQPMQKKALKK